MLEPLREILVAIRQAEGVAAREHEPRSRVATRERADHGAQHRQVLGLDLGGVAVLPWVFEQTLEIVDDEQDGPATRTLLLAGTFENSAQELLDPLRLVPQPRPLGPDELLGSRAG